VSWVVEKFKYQREAEKIEPAAVITTKDSKWWTALWVSLVVVTLGLFAIGQPYRVFMEKFATTVGPVQGYPRKWAVVSIRTIVHECRHTKDVIFFGWFVPVLGWISNKLRAWVGLLPAGLVYGLLPFPVLLCYGRYKMELRADTASYHWMLEDGCSPEEVRSRAVSFAETVGSGKYFWPWPKPLVRRGFKIAAEQVIRQHQIDNNSGVS
jgi:hypothetical protein